MTVAGDNIKPDTCGCCKADVAGTDHVNAPGLPEVKYRAGTHPVILKRMKAGIFKWTVPDGDFNGKRPLKKLATRTADDPAVAMMDAWATVADVLTFYQERIANEGFLRTATERRSILELARSIGYELSPGVSAEAWLAFTVDEAEGSPPRAEVPKGTQVQSLPAKQGELPQTFETAEELIARVAWNGLRPRLKHPQTLTSTMTHAYLQGTATNFEAGDLVLLVISGMPHPKKILKIKTDTENQYTRIDFEKVESNPATAVMLYPDAVLNLTREQLKLTPANVKTEIFMKAWKEKELQAFLVLHEWSGDEVLKYIDELRAASFASSSELLFALREQLGFFGHNAPYFKSLPDNDGTSTKDSIKSVKRKIVEHDMEEMIVVTACISTKEWPYDWDCLGMSIWKDSITNHYYDAPPEEYCNVYLEQPVSGLGAGGWAVFEKPSNEYACYLIAEVSEVSRTGYGMSIKVMGLDLHDKNGNPLANTSADKPSAFKVRNSRAYVKSEKMQTAPLPIAEDLEKGLKELWLDTMTLGLIVGQLVAISGEEVESDGQKRSEMLELAKITHSSGYTRLTFTEGPAYSYKRNTVRINANVVRANHGEAVLREVLGSGNGAEAHQRFTLKKSPLTHVTTSTASGAESSLSVRVDNVEWDQKTSLYGLDQDSRNYIVRIDNEAGASIVFGDGKSGARLPTGQENVVAMYRSGIGLDGEVAALSLTLLKKRPYGIRSVTNPLKATGADNPETLDKARDNAPLTVLTLDRIVSLQDYEDFVRSFAGIGKAQASVIWDGEADRLHLTVADSNGDAVVSPLYDNLLAAVEDARDPLGEVILESFQPLVFFVTAKILMEKGYQWKNVKALAEQALLDAFCFDRRSFGQPVSAAEVLRVIHGVAGVKAVDLDKLYKATPGDTSMPASIFNAILSARRARYDKNLVKIPPILPAQLLLIHKLGINLSEMSS